MTTKPMTARELIEMLQQFAPDAPVHVDMDDYPFVSGGQSGSMYDGPTEYTPPTGCVLLTVDFPTEN